MSSWTPEGQSRRWLQVGLVLVAVLALGAVVATGGAFAADAPDAGDDASGGALAADINTTERTVSDTSVPAGGTTTVEVFVDTEGVLSNQGLVQVKDEFSPAFAAVEANDSLPGAGGASAGPQNEKFRAIWNEDANNYTVSYDVTIPEDAEVGDEFTVSGTVEVDGQTQSLPSETITVALPDTTGVKLAPTSASASPQSQRTFNVVATGVDEGVTSFSVNVSTNNTAVASFSSVAPANQATTDNSTVASDGSWMLLEADLSNAHAAASEVVIGTVAVDTGQEGVANLSIDQSAVASSGGSYTIERTESSTLTVSDLPTLPNAQGQVADNDGDGVYEDVDGSGSANIFDALSLYNNLETPAVQNNPDVFDYDDSGSVDLFDALQLYNIIQG